MFFGQYYLGCFQYYLGCLSHASYLIGDTTSGRAVVVDPRRYHLHPRCDLRSRRPHRSLDGDELVHSHDEVGVSTSHGCV